MSQPFPLSAFGSLADSQTIAAIQGVLVKLFPAKTGTSSAGAYSLQNGEIEQDGVTVPVTFKDREELPQTMRGKMILLTASNEKGLKGLYCWDDTRNNQTVRKIKVTPSASLDIIDGGSSRYQQQHNEPPQSQPRQQSAPQQQHAQYEKPNHTPPPQTGSQKLNKEELEFQDARRTINQIANLHLLCMLAVERYEASAFKELSGRDMSEPQRQAAVASIFIKADREGLVRYMPVVDATKDPRFNPNAGH